MVWSQEGDAERPPLSVILPRLYLGAESDVTQDQLTSLGISYVLSVSRCSPRPPFLPCSRYLRIPIDDSLWADLLPWIPQALHFIDAAMSSGASVLVHCAAGISRSPALAVAYIMYSLGMDLDHAYRFVKERRPSISPNFNFLGQLQHFQSTLSTRPPGGDLLIQQLDNGLRPVSDGHTPSNQDTSCQTDGVKLWTLNRIQQESQTLFSVSAPSSCEPVKPAPKPTQLQLPAASASLAEKRKSLSLSLTPLGICPPSQTSSSQQERSTTMSGTVHKAEALRSSDSHGEFRAPRHKQEQGMLSPLSYTLNKLLCWGERVLLGGVFVHNVRMGQAALPYRC